MLELIAMVCGVVLCVYLPYEVDKVRNGWVRKSFKGSPEEFRAAYLKTLRFFMGMGIALGAINLAIAPLNQEHGEWIFGLATAAIWFAVAAVAYFNRSKLAQQPT